MKKILGILLLAMLLGFVACGDGGKDTGNVPEPTKEVAETQAPEETEAPEETATPELTATPEPEGTEASDELEIQFVPITATYKVILTEVGPERVKAIKLLWELNDKADLPGAKDAIDNPPCVLYETIHQAAAENPCTVIEVTNKKDAELIAATFTEVGATVEITEAE